jgi:hypothetical protein
MTPASTFEKTVCGGNLAQSDSIGQIAARIDLPPPSLAHVQSFSAGMLAFR